MNKKNFAEKIIRWYETNKRNLPWREAKDPYKIWLSEVILQQTRVAQGLPYYNSFVKTFPDVFSLASAPQQTVLRLWQGLGYYSRARNLHNCARKIVAGYNGIFPSVYSELIKLPGIGSYTAAAIASISFKEPVAVVDGNVFRVLARVFGYDLDISSPEGKKFFTVQANELISLEHPDIYNQAVMEFGALHCTPQNPKCDDCIFSVTCVANKKGLQNLLPVKSKKLKIKKRYLYYFMIMHKGKILMQQRESKDIWHGLYDFYLAEGKKNQKAQDLIPKNISGENATIHVSEKVKHVLSHQHLFIQFVKIEIAIKKLASSFQNNSNLKWYSKDQVHELPKPIVINKFLEKSGFFEQP